jgi:ferric iron reductase protein FhuF
VTFLAVSCAACSGVFTFSITSCIICGTYRFMMSDDSGTAGKEMPYWRLSVVTLRKRFSARRRCCAGRLKASRLPGLEVSHW